MAKIKIKLSKGDSVISVTEKAIFVQRKNGEVDIIPIISDSNTLRGDIENIVIIAVGVLGLGVIVALGFFVKKKGYEKGLIDGHFLGWCDGRSTGYDSSTKDAIDIINSFE